MSVLINLIGGSVEAGKTSITGTTLTRPSLVYTDGINVTYAVDVDTGQEGTINENGDLGVIPLYNVPIAAGNNSLIYAEIGAAVTLTKSPTGQWQVTGFAKTHPGTFTVTCVTLPTYCLRVPTENLPGPPQYHLPVIGETISIGLGARALTYGEIGLLGTYGVTPYGATTLLVGGVPVTGVGGSPTPLDCTPPAIDPALLSQILEDYTIAVDGDATEYTFEPPVVPDTDFDLEP